MDYPKQKITTFLMFEGKAEEAMQFSDKFAWVEDKYGISWQLILERN